LKSFLLISDIHACDDDPTGSSAASYVSTHSASSRNIDPFTELERLISEEDIKANFILCPGDITNRAKPAPFAYAWERLNQLSKTMRAPLIATVGNHDVDSRYMGNSYDAAEFAKALQPAIPVCERSRYLEFWAENFSLIATEECNVLSLNTAAYHGAGKDVSAEIEYGRISAATLAAITRTLDSAPKSDINVLLCHHHLLKTDLTDTAAAGITRGGDALVDLLNGRSESWIVVHGHRHAPELFYGHGGSNSPVIIGCASFSAQVNFDAQNKNPNQVHLLTCDPGAAQNSGWSSAGNLQSWTWQAGIGWKRAHGPHGLQHITGFGYRSSVRFLATQTDAYLKAKGVEHISWHDAVADLPSLQMLIPSDFRAFEAALDDHRIAILMDRDGSYAQIGRRA
jgi:hypothetical protein